MKPARMRPRRQQFIACNREPHTRPSDHRHFSLADGAKNSQILWTQDSSRLEQYRAASNVFAAAANILSRRDGSQRADVTRALVLRLRHALGFHPFGG